MKINHDIMSTYILLSNFMKINQDNSGLQGRIQDFKLGGAHLKKLRRAEGGAKIVGVFRVKNHDFTQKNHVFQLPREARKFLRYFV